jgi:hypothetical protein
MQWITFSPGEEPEVLTGDLCSIYGCDTCPGYARVRDLPAGRMRSGEAPADPDATVLCSHSCHRISDEELALEVGDQRITVTCLKCGAVQTLPGFLHVEMFVCQGRGEAVEVVGGQVQ